MQTINKPEARDLVRSINLCVNTPSLLLLSALGPHWGVIAQTTDSLSSPALLLQVHEELQKYASGSRLRQPGSAGGGSWPGTQSMLVGGMFTPLLCRSS
jgi:hypothetical protein